MEAVAAQAFRMQLLWNGIMICNCTVAAVKRRIEAGNLRELRKTRENVDGSARDCAAGAGAQVAHIAQAERAPPRLSEPG